MIEYNPNVSIVMPCYNAEKFIGESIDSIITQTYTNWELIVVDDCSKDSSAKIVGDYSDERIKLIRLEKNHGNPAIPRNIGIENSRGRYIAFIDSDDIWLPEKLEKQVAYMIDNDIAINATSYMLMDEKGNNTGKIIRTPLKLTQKGYMKNTKIGFSSSVIDRGKIKKISFEPMPIAEDYLFWVNTLGQGYNLIGLDEVLMKYRVQKKSISSNKVKSALQILMINTHYLKINKLTSYYYFFNYAMNAVIKRIIS